MVVIVLMVVRKQMASSPSNTYLQAPNSSVCKSKHRSRILPAQSNVQLSIQIRHLNENPDPSRPFSSIRKLSRVSVSLSILIPFPPPVCLEPFSPILATWAPGTFWTRPCSSFLLRYNFFVLLCDLPYPADDEPLFSPGSILDWGRCNESLCSVPLSRPESWIVAASLVRIHVPLIRIDRFYIPR